MKRYVKKLYIFIFLIFGFIFLSVIDVNVNASTFGLAPFTAPSEWGSEFQKTSWTRKDDFEFSSNKVEGTSNPSFEYKYTLYTIDHEYSGYYVAILIDMYVNPGNIKGKGYKSKSDLVVVDSYINSQYYGTLYDGGPVSTPGSTTITTSVGGGISLGADPKGVSGSISGSFSSSRTNSYDDLIIAAFRESHYNTPNSTRFRVEYDYYDPYRNNIAYLYSSTPLQYAAVYHITTAGRASVKILFDIDFIWDGTIFEGNHTAKLSFSNELEFSKSAGYFKVYG